MLNYIKRSFRGEIPLWQAFWGWGCVGHIVLLLAWSFTLSQKITHAANADWGSLWGIINLFWGVVYLPISAFFVLRNFKNKSFSGFSIFFISILSLAGFFFACAMTNLLLIRIFPGLGWFILFFAMYITSLFN